MNHSIATLTATLQKALNSNYEVTDMATVLFVISQLENATITKEQLETTQLAKYIKKLRRRTWSEPLARRAKNLIKKWREMILPTLGTQQQQSSSPAVTGASGSGVSTNLQQQQQEQMSLRSISSGSVSQPSSPTMLATTSAIRGGGHFYQQHQQERQQHSSNYDLNYDSRSSSKNIELSLPDYPGNSYNRKLMNTGSANKRNEQQILIDEGNTTEYQQKQHRYSSNSYNRKSINTGSANEIEQQQRHQQQFIVSNGGGGSNLSIDDRLMMSVGGSGGNISTSKTRTKLKASKFDSKSDTRSSRKSSNRNQPTSFANLLPSTQINDIGLHSSSSVPTVQSVAAGFVDDRSHSPVVVSPSTISRKSKHQFSHSIDHHHRSPITIEHSVSPLDFDHNSNQSRDNSVMMMDGGSGVSVGGAADDDNIKNNTDPAAIFCNSSSNNKASSMMVNGDSRSRLPQMMIELNDSNSNSNLIMINTLDSSMQPPSPLINLYNNISLCNLEDNETQLTEHRKSKKHKKDKKKHKQHNQKKPESNNRLLNEMSGTVGVSSSTGRLLLTDQMHINEKHHNYQQHPDTIFPPHDSLSNSSLSIFPNTSTNATAVTSAATNVNRDHFDGDVGDCKYDLTFAGKFNKNFNSYSNNTLPPNQIEEISIQKQRNFPIMMNAQNNTVNISSSSLSKRPRRKEIAGTSIVVIESRSCSPFTPIVGNSDDSCTLSSHISSNHHDMIDAITNQESQSGIIDIRATPSAITAKSSGKQQHSKLVIKHGDMVPATEGGAPIENTGGLMTATHQMKSSLISGNNGVSIAPNLAGATVTTTSDNESGLEQHKLQYRQQFVSSNSSNIPATIAATATKTPKKRGRKKKLKTVEPQPTTPGNFLNTQLFENSRLLSIATLTTNKKVKTTKELLADIQNRKLESATSSPTLMHSQSSRLPSPCSETSLQSPITSDACSTNATMSTIARSTPDLQTHQIPIRSGDIIDDSASDSNTIPGVNIQKSTQSGFCDEIGGSSAHIYGGSSKDNEIVSTTATEKHQNCSSLLKQHQQQKQRTVDDEIANIMKLLPPIDRTKIQWNYDNEVICTCRIRENEHNPDDDDRIKVEFQKDDEEHLSTLTATSPMVISPGNVTMAPIISASPAIKSLKSFSDENSISMLLSSSKSRDGSPITTISLEKNTSTTARKPPIKSIFDLDYDDDDDPLNSIVETANKSCLQYSSPPKGAADLDIDDKKNETNDDDDFDDKDIGEVVDDDNDDVKTSDHTIKKRKKKLKRHRRQQQQLNSEIMDNSSTTPSSVATQQSITTAMLQSLKQQHQQPTTVSGGEGNNNVGNNHNQSQTTSIVSQFPYYEAIEDPNCPAKELYVTQRNRITLYHVNALHNRFITNVNGNWDHSGLITTKSTTTTTDYIIKTDDIGNSRLKLINSNSDNEDNDELTANGLYKRVVPQHNHIIMDKIPKDLSHVKFTRNYKIKKNSSDKIKMNFDKFKLESLRHHWSSFTSDESSISMMMNENDMTLHKHTKRTRLNNNDDDTNDRKAGNKNNDADSMDKKLLNTDKCKHENNLNNDKEEYDELINSNNNRNSYIRSTTTAKTVKTRNFHTNDSTMMVDDNDYENMMCGDNEDGGGFMIMEAIDNEHPIKLENYDNRNNSSKAELVIMMETVNDRQNVFNVNESNNKIRPENNDRTIATNYFEIAADSVAVGTTIDQQQKNGDDERMNNEQNANDEIQLHSKMNRPTVIGNRRHRRSSNCSSSSSNHSVNINLNIYNKEISNNNNDRNFMNNDNDNNTNNHLNSLSVGGTSTAIRSATVVNDNDHHNNGYNDDGDDISVDHDDNHQSSQHSMHSNYTEEHYDNDEGSENEDDDDDYNDDGGAGGGCGDDGDGGSGNTDDQHHHQVVVKHDMISSTLTTSQKHIVLTIKKTPVDNFKKQQQMQKHDISINSITTTTDTVPITTTNTENKTAKTTIAAIIDNSGDDCDVITSGNDKSTISSNFESNNNNNNVNSQNNNTTIIQQQQQQQKCSSSSSFSNCLRRNDLLIMNDDNMAVSSDNAVNYIKSDNKSNNNLNNYNENSSSIIKIEDNDKNKNNLLIKNQIIQTTTNKIDDDDDVDGDNYGDSKINSNDDDDDMSYDDYQKTENFEFIETIKKFEKNYNLNDSCNNNDDKYNIDSLPIENNGLLESFNNLNDENIIGIRKIIKEEKIGNSNIINSNSSSNCNCNGTNNQQQQQQQNEQLQQFKEWHEVHQVRSYNDELLTILPYVVID